MPSNPTVELWTLYAVGVSFTVLRTSARVAAVGVRGLAADDYLIWLAIAIYTAQCILGHQFGISSHGLANNGLAEQQRRALSILDPEYTWRVIGSKIQVAGWTTAACLLWTLKLCMAFFYLRLTSGIRGYPIRIYIAMGILVTTFTIIIFTIYLSCRPFYHYWQISPDPGNSCQAAVSKPIVWVTFILNVLTDIILITIPVPMLWKSSLRPAKKLAATLVLSAGVLIIVCAILKSVYVIIDPMHGGQLAAAWGTRETFIAVVTTNLPMTFHLLRNFLKDWIPASVRSSSYNKASRTRSSGFVTIGGGGGGPNRPRKNPYSVYNSTVSANLDNDSEERIIARDGDVNLQPLPAIVDARNPVNTIVVSNKISVTSEESRSK